MKKNLVYLFAAIIVCFAFRAISHSSGYKTPYGVNSWDTPHAAQDLLKLAGITRYRQFVKWRDAEPVNLPAGSPNYDFWFANKICDFGNYAGARACLLLTDIPTWAWNLRKGDGSWDKAAFIQEFVTFTLDIIKHCDSISPGTIDMLDVGNEWLVWDGEQAKDPGNWYAELLKATYSAVKAYNPNITIVTASMFWRYGEMEGEYADQLYQLGCKGYFDRLNFHYYLRDRWWKHEGDPISAAEEPWYTGFKNHYPTVLRYCKWLCEQNGDNVSLPINSEYGWTLMSTFEDKKASYYQYILDVSRRSGFTDMTYMYPGSWQDYPNFDDTSATPCDSAALIYTDTWNNPANVVVPTTSYFMYKTYHTQYPDWDPALRNPEPQLPAASADAVITDPGFENGNTGWTGATLDSSEKHSGNYSGRSAIPGTIQSASFPVEKSKLYEMVYWIKVTGSGSVGRNFDTSAYPGGWKRYRTMILTGANDTSWSLTFTGGGSGTFWIDDVSFKSLNMGDPVVVSKTSPPGRPINLLCDGMVSPQHLKNLTPEFAWTFNDVDQGDVQSAFQVIVADNLTSINSNTGNLYDSNKITSVSVRKKYAGTTLTPGTYYWKVRTWDYVDTQGIYSDYATFTIDPVITVIAPNGDDLWGVGSTQTIRWSSVGAVGNVNINLSTDGGNTYNIPIAANTSNDGIEVITVPNNQSMNCMLRIQEPDGVPSDTSDTAFAISAGGINTALRFTSSPDGGNFGSDSSLNIYSGNATGLTIEMWIKMDTGSGWKTILARENNGGYSVNLWDNYLRYRVMAPTEIMFEDNSTKLTTGKWQHLAVTAEGTTGRIFIDGSLIATKTDFAMPSTANNSLNLAAFGGTIDELRISNIARYSASFTPPSAPYTSDGNTMGLWHFDEGSGMATADVTGKNNCTLSGNPQWVLGYFGGSQSRKSITVTFPEGGETFGVYGQMYVTWACQGGVGNVNLDLSVDNGSTWTSLAQNVINTGNTAVIIPNRTGSLCKIRVSDASGSPQGFSGNFAITGGSPVLGVSATSLNFSDIARGNSSSIALAISNRGGGILTGTIQASENWITVDKQSFSLDSSAIANVNVVVSNANLSEGGQAGKLTITTNSGSPLEIPVLYTATCVLARPNPVKASDLDKTGITFYGDGIVPGETTLKIYNLGGELVDVITRSEVTNQSITWQSSNLVPGIYIYTYESPKEKGINKFTVIK